VVLPEAGGHGQRPLPLPPGQPQRSRRRERRGGPPAGPVPRVAPAGLGTRAVGEGDEEGFCLGFWSGGNGFSSGWQHSAEDRVLGFSFRFPVFGFVLCVIPLFSLWKHRGDIPDDVHAFTPRALHHDLSRRVMTLSQHVWGFPSARISPQGRQSPLHAHGVIIRRSGEANRGHGRPPSANAGPEVPNEGRVRLLAPKSFRDRVMPSNDRLA